MSAQVVHLPVRRQREAILTYDQLRIELEKRGHRVSKRWLQYRASEGMPFDFDYAGRKVFRLSEVLPWLDRWAADRRRAG